MRSALPPEENPPPYSSDPPPDPNHVFGLRGSRSSDSEDDDDGDSYDSRLSIPRSRHQPNSHVSSTCYCATSSSYSSEDSFDEALRFQDERRGGRRDRGCAPRSTEPHGRRHRRGWTAPLRDGGDDSEYSDTPEHNYLVVIQRVDGDALRRPRCESPRPRGRTDNSANRGSRDLRPDSSSDGSTLVGSESRTSSSTLVGNESAVSSSSSEFSSSPPPPSARSSQRRGGFVYTTPTGSTTPSPSLLRRWRLNHLR